MCVSPLRVKTEEQKRFRRFFGYWAFLDFAAQVLYAHSDGMTGKMHKTLQSTIRIV